ncbi:DeoR/GlpR family DNA-binding transcription regulator [uncultured Brachybacterium sp.]|uniref:DeoR/GlpR family DNA-binding transcription regulator n=1 Tax=uncultured Brachybacterium sp. TaxID=189680 RepID=UPI00262BE699|nr:DeoR/GlpR family DNA-binding transcription regulator [uncultured Brachybacterium sp.]
MIRVARLDAIESMLQEQKVVSTHEIVDVLKVSGATARRDLDDLVAEGRVVRVHGGAKLPENAEEDPSSLDAEVTEGSTPHEAAEVDEPFHEVLTRNSALKRTLARAAAALVADGETLFLDIGTTTYELARCLLDRPLTVVTNSLGVVDVLSASQRGKLVVLGGEYNREYRCTQGRSVQEELRELHIDRAFLGCAGITELGIVRDNDARQAAIKRAAAECSGETTVLADSSKIPGIGAYTALELASVDRLVIDRPLPTALARLCADASTEVLVP